MKSEVYRARMEVLEVIGRILTDGINGRRFAVVRGPINYATWSYDSHPLACALIAADFPLRRRGSSPFREMDIVLEMTTQVDPSPPAGSNLWVPGPVDSVLDCLAQDAEVILAGLEAARNGQDDPVVSRIWNDPEPRCREMYGADWRVQGIEVTFTVDF